MCRPPDIVPQAPDFHQAHGAAAGGNFDLVAAAAAAMARSGGGGIPATKLPVFAPSAPVGQLLGYPSLKRALAATAGHLQSMPYQGPAKVMRTSVSSEFDDAASTFIARMEESVIADIKQQQVQQQQQQLQQMQQQMLLDKYIAQAQEHFPRANPAPTPSTSPLDTWLRAAAMRGSPAPSPAPATFNASIPAARFLGAAGAVTGLPAAPVLSVASPAVALTGVARQLPLTFTAQSNLVAAAGMGGVGGDSSAACLSLAGEGESEEKKVKRIMSNRASAKRSRQRRQERLDELEKETELLHENHAVVVAQLGRATDQLGRMQRANDRLARELDELRKAAGGAGMTLLPAAAAAVWVKEEKEQEEASAAAAAAGVKEAAKSAAIFEGLLPADGAPAAAAGKGQGDDGVSSSDGSACVFGAGHASPKSVVTDWSASEQEGGAYNQQAGASAAAAACATDALFLDDVDCSALGGIAEDDLFASLMSCFDGVV